MSHIDPKILRKLIIGKTVVVLACLLLLCFFLVRLYFGVKGLEMVRSKCPNSVYNSTIIVRHLPASTSSSALNFSLIPRFSNKYRCELYGYGADAFFSAQTYFREGYQARTARVIWEKSGAATVYLDDAPVLTCDKYGYWRQPALDESGRGTD